MEDVLRVEAGVGRADGLIDDGHQMAAVESGGGLVKLGVKEGEEVLNEVPL